MIGQELGASVTYTWFAQRRGFLRNTLNAGNCDLVPGIPAKMEMLRTTQPYYRSGYVFVRRESNASDHLARRSRAEDAENRRATHRQ